MQNKRWKQLCVLVSLAGCSLTPVGTKYIKTQAVSAALGGTITVENADDLNLAGTKISVPPDALAQDTQITIAEGEGFTVAELIDGEAGSPVADFGPGGTNFKLPVTITLPLSGGTDSDLSVLAVEADGTQSEFAASTLAIDSNAGTVTFQASGFTRFGVIRHRHHRDAGSPCPDGEGECCGVCSRGLCPADACVRDGGTGPCPVGENECCGVCQPPGFACAALCVIDGGNFCPPGDVLCNGLCIPETEPCQISDGGSGEDAGVCPPGEVPCNGGCIIDTLVCPISDGGGFPDSGPICNGQPVCCDGTCPYSDDAGLGVCPQYCFGDGGGFPDSGPTCNGQPVCCDGTCQTTDDAGVGVCPQVCYDDGGVQQDGGSVADGGACPPGYAPCCGACVVDTAPICFCPAQDAGVEQDAGVIGRPDAGSRGGSDAG